MTLKKKIDKRLDRINGFLESGRKPTLTIVHELRLEVKHLQAFSELMILQDNFGTGGDVSGRLGKLFHEAGEFRNFGLEIKAIDSIADHNRLAKPIIFMDQLGFSKKKSGKKLRKIQKRYPLFKTADFLKHPRIGLSSDTWHQFLINRASSILELFKQDEFSDIKQLHHLRKILKSILYVLPVCKSGEKQVRVFLKTRRRFIKSVESKIGSMHDTDLFLRRLEKKQEEVSAAELATLRKIKREWQHDIVNMRKDLRPLLPSVRQFALDLKDKSTRDLNPVAISSDEIPN
jgi:hypothetical protein